MDLSSFSLLINCFLIDCKVPVKGTLITPTPKPAPKVYNPAGGGMDGRIGAGGGGSKGTQIPTIPAGKDVRKTANQYGIGSR